MRARPDHVEPALLLGYLGRDEVLYCSRACALARGQQDAKPVEADEYQALLDRGSSKRTDVVCPVCGSEYPIDWADDED